MVRKLASDIIGKLSKSQVRTVGQIVQNIANVFFASMAIEPLLKGAVGWSSVVLGFSLAFVVWIISIMIMK